MSSLIHDVDFFFSFFLRTLFFFCFFFLLIIFFLFFFFFFLSTTVTNYNKKEKTQQEGLGNPKLKLRTKVRGGNVSEDAGPLARGTDATKPRSPLKVISNVY